MNGLQTFTNEEFGAVRSLVIEDMPWFVGTRRSNRAGIRETAKRG